MQTFVPFPDLSASAQALDDRRLGKQRVETLQVMRALTIEGYGWRHHPAVAMWRGHRPALMAYQDACCDEWARRGFADTCRAKTLETLDADARDGEDYRAGRIPMPAWWARPEVHRSHRSKLLAKDPEFYRERFPHDPDDLEYVWPGEG